MDFNKFCENGKKIKLTEEKKAEIINVSKESEVQKAAPFSPNLKRIAAAVCAMIIMVTAVFVYNKHNNTNDIPIHSATEQSEKESLKAVETTTVQPSQKIENTTEGDGMGCGDILPRKYRNNYYSIPASFADIVGRDVFLIWEDEYLSENYPDNSNEMVMVAYVKAFDIPKEEFERANLEYAKFIDEVYSHICLDPQDYADQEFQEIYNTEIIYTFDNEIINEYYLGIDYPFLNEYQYDEAIADGTYQTRTTEFITLEQMEADIIAKYGESEIVTETTIPEEITATDLSQIETTE